MFDAEGSLLYVGRSSRGPRRFGEHRMNQRWWRSVETVKVEHFDFEREAVDAERLAIESEQPRFNVVYSGAAA